MIFYKNIYLSENIKKKKNTIIHNIKNNKIQLDVFIISLSEDGMGIVDIYPSYILLQKEYMNKEIFIIGIASTKTEAYNIAKDILMDCYNTRSDFDISAYARGIGGDK